MDELDLFRDFRRGVAAPSADARQRASARLTSAIEGPRRPGARVLRPIRHRPGRTVLAFAALAGAAAAALFVSSPWKTSPGFLERAQAALTPPAGTVLHAKYEWTRTVVGRCTVTDPPVETWVDQTPPHNYRVLGSSVDRNPCVASGPPVELGGAGDRQEVLEFVPPSTLRPTDLFRPGAPDPVASLRQALSDGRAHYDGTTEIEGRTVERIRLDPPSPCPPQFPDCNSDPGYVYVDPETLYPVQADAPHGLAIPTPGGEPVPFRNVIRWLTFEFLPGTADNRALADIRAQHPNASGP